MISKKKVYLTALFMFWLGYEAKDNRIFPLTHFYKRHFVDYPEHKQTKTEFKFGVFTDINSRQRVDCPPPEDAEVVVSFGQSNAANSGGYRHTNSDPKILNFFAGHCYVASDPMLGASENRGSMWIPFARAYQSDKTLVLATFAVGATKIEQWLVPDVLGAHFDSNMASLSKAGYTPDLMIWFQGESDHDSDPVQYEQDLNSFLAYVSSSYPNSRLAISGTSYCARNSSAKLVAAQQRVATKLGSTWLGVTDDIIGSEYRYDDCHLSRPGMQRVANQFVKALRN